MKKIITASIIIACGFSNKIIAQANTALSNLTPTAINANLLPGTANSINLGSAVTPWKDIYFNGSLFYGNSKAISFDTSNTAVGLNALTLNTSSGLRNTALGKSTLASNTVGDDNAASGYYALYSNTTGANNTANGAYSLYANTTGYSNSANGSRALYSNTTGYNNTANGFAALKNNTTGYDNTANGYGALYNNTTGNFNTANGFAALNSNSTGNYNTANGYNALYYNTTGNYNTANGFSTLISNKTGIENTASGGFSLNYNTTGNDNTANGYYALYQNTTGNYNTAAGVGALYHNTTGRNNTFVGYYADVAAGDLYNATGIGSGASVNASNKVVIGNTNVTVIGGQVGWSTFSDGRFKSNIRQNVPGLAFINKLNPVTYTLELKKFDQFLGKKDSLINSMQAEYAVNEKKIHTGFVAQEVERAAKDLSFDFDGVNVPKNDKDNYSIAYADFVPSLVKAVQELSVQNDAKQDQIDSLKSELNELKKLVRSIQQTQPRSAYSNAVNEPAANVKTAVRSEATLHQNMPNPFSNTTAINYTLPQKYAQAYIIITDKSGKTLKQVNVSGSGKGSARVDASLLPSGTFYYSLVVDGQQVATKQMVQIR